MDKLRFWMTPVALCFAWMVVAAFLLVSLARASSQPVATFSGPEVVIEVTAPASVLAER